MWMFDELTKNKIFYLNAFYLSCCQAIAMSMIILIIATGSEVGDVFGVSRMLSTLPVALATAGGAITMIPASYILAKFGRKKGFLFGAVLGLLSCLVLAIGILIRQYFVVLAGYAMLGCLISFSSYFRFAVTDGVNPVLVGRGVSIVLFGGITSSVLGSKASIIAASIDSGPEFIGAPIVMSVLLVCMFLLLCLYRDGGSDTRRSLKIAGFAKAITFPNFYRIVLIGSVGYSLMSLIMNAMPVSMKQYGFGMENISYIMGAHFFSMFAPSFFTGYLVDRFGAKRVIAFGMSCYLSCFLVALFDQGFYGFLTALILLGVGWNFTFLPATSMLTLCVPLEYRKEAEGINDTVINIVNVASSLLAGVFVVLFGWKGLASLAIFIVLVVVLVATFSGALFKRSHLVDNELYKEI